MFAGVDEESHTNPIVQVAKYVAGPLATPLYLVGVMTNDVEDGGHGRATAFGKVRNLNTTGSSSVRAGQKVTYFGHTQQWRAS